MAAVAGVEGGGREGEDGVGGGRDVGVGAAGVVVTSIIYYRAGRFLVHALFLSVVVQQAYICIK